MIYALNDQNERINASKAVKEKTYLCPNLECENRELILKKGQIRIPHFAHKSKKDCYSEPESEAHLSCKLYFQSLLELDNRFVEYYGIVGVRPDVLYNQFALEIQCSPIPVDEVIRRNKIYGKKGFVAIWIFLEDSFTSIKKTEIQKEKSEWEKKLDRHGIMWRPEVTTESKPSYDIAFRVKEPVLQGSFQGIGRRNLKSFSFKYENEDVQVNFNEYGDKLFDDYTKKNELAIISKQDFDRILEEIEILIKDKKEFHELKKKLNSLPKQIQGNLFEILDVNVAHISGRDFYDGVNNFNIGMFIHDVFREKDCTMEAFKAFIEKMLIKAYTKDKGIKDWRNKNTIERNGKKYVPLCRIEKINRETPIAYTVWFDQWIPKSLAYKDNKYIYCEEWKYKKISKGKNRY